MADMILFVRSSMAVAAACTALAAPSANARITKFEITTKESPTFGGYSWSGVGQYEKIAGKAYGEVNSKDPKNALNVDIKLAPKNARGNVEYAFGSSELSSYGGRRHST